MSTLQTTLNDNRYKFALKLMKSLGVETAKWTCRENLWHGIYDAITELSEGKIPNAPAITKER